MPYREVEFTNNEIYHITLRGLDEKKLFFDDNDYYRMIFSVYEFNDIHPAKIRERRKERLHIKEILKDKTNTLRECDIDKRERIVDLLAFCWMPNHIHLLVRQLQDNGITKFMSKVGIGYAKYFNTKYGRKGYVFQNRFKSTHVKNDNYLQTIFVYVHTNPISLIEPSWKEKGITNKEKAIEFIENYKWSSYQDYLDKPNFRYLSQRDSLKEFFGGAENCRQQVNDWLAYKSEYHTSGV